MLRRCAVSALFVLLSVSARSMKSDEVIDISKTVPVSSRIPCDGSTAPEDEVTAKATFSEGPTERSFTLSEFQQGSCPVNLKIHCFDKKKTGWRQEWAVTNTHAQHPMTLPLSSCYVWGSKEAAQYVLSGWYKPAGATKKTAWIQTEVKKISTHPDVYEFSDGTGGTARLEMSRR